MFPGDPAFSLETIATIPADGYYLQFVREGKHTGTHWGAPGHFTEGAALADQMDPGDLLLPAVKIDIRDQAAANADYAVTVDDIKSWERRHGRIPNGFHGRAVDRLGVPLGHARVPEPRRERPDPPAGLLDSGGALVDRHRSPRPPRWHRHRHVQSPDVGTEETYTVSKLVYQRRRMSLEILANLAKLPTTGAWVLAGGPIHRNGSGSTATIFGLIPPGVD